MANTVAEIKNLKKSFGQNEVLKGISLLLEKGENLAVMGKSGSGKSVLIKCIVGLLPAESGSISILGQDLKGLNNTALNGLRKKIGFLFQGAALYDSMSVEENLEFPLRDTPFKSDSEKKNLIMEALENVGLGDALRLMPSELSGGMKKRVGLARAIILKPEIILYDEPTTGLDPITSKEISLLILDIQKKYQTASIIITHDLECARLTSNRISMIKEGAFVAEGTFASLSESKDEWLCSFFH